MDKVNQCQGCQAGWELKKSKYFGDYYHVVEGGYPGEQVSCTKHLYIEEENEDDTDQQESDR